MTLTHMIAFTVGLFVGWIAAHWWGHARVKDEKC